MPEIDPWDVLNSRYEHDDHARFTAVFDSLEEAVRLVASPRLSDRRMALITADYVADVLLAQRVKRVIELSEAGPTFEPRTRFDVKARGLLRQRFNRRVTVAVRDFGRRFTMGLGAPIIDAEDAEVLRVAHAYRNDVYHDDRHNDTALPIVATAALHTVAHAWMASLPANVAQSVGTHEPLLRRLQTKGYEPPEWASGSLSLHHGADAVRAWILDTLPIDLKAYRSTLADDLTYRLRYAEEMVAWLSGPWGPGAERIEPGLRWHDLWRQHRADPDLLALDEERALVWERVMQSPEEERDETTYVALRAADEAYETRFGELVSSHDTSLRLSDLPRLGARAKALRQITRGGALLAQYRTLDMEVRVFEETLDEMAIGWDRYVQDEEDRRRGK